MKITLGLDIGSIYTKAVLMDQDYNLIARHVACTGYKLQEIAEFVTNEVLRKVGKRMDSIGYTIATGYGRDHVPFRDLQVTDLTAAARGAAYLFPGTRSILDIGGQTIRATKVDENAKVVAFRLNDKCGGGTGGFLERVIRNMGYRMEDIDSLIGTSTEKVNISSVCAVFAESEMIGHLSEGVPPEYIIHGAMLSLARRSVQLFRRIKATGEYTLLGGVVIWKMMAAVFRDSLNADINVPSPDLSQFVGAIGCAILGQRKLL